MKKELKEFLPICGIYTIVNKLTGKVYVGQSKNIIGRWAKHVEDLTNNVHTNKQLQDDWNMYGANSFSANVIRTCSSDVLLSEESYCIKEYRGLAGVYNIGVKKLEATQF